MTDLSVIHEDCRGPSKTRDPSVYLHTSQRLAQMAGALLAGMALLMNQDSPLGE